MTEFVQRDLTGAFVVTHVNEAESEAGHSVQNYDLPAKELVP
jgi:hypothetical protein